MGPYCRYCNHRCFLLRILRDGRTMLLATCARGMAHDREVCGQDHTTAINPVTDPDAARALADAPPRPCTSCGLPVVPSGRGWTVVDTGTSADGLSYCPPDPDADAHHEHRPEPAQEVTGAAQ